MRVQPQAIYFNPEIRFNRSSLPDVGHDFLFPW